VTIYFPNCGDKNTKRHKIIINNRSTQSPPTSPTSHTQRTDCPRRIRVFLYRLQFSSPSAGSSQPALNGGSREDGVTEDLTYRHAEDTGAHHTNSSDPSSSPCALFTIANASVVAVAVASDLTRNSIAALCSMLQPSTRRTDQLHHNN
jgi:hypothetical protein